MADFNRGLRQGETVRRSAGISNVSLLVDAGMLAVVVAAYRVGTQYLLRLSSGSALSASMLPFSKLMMNWMTALLAIVALWGMLVTVSKSLFTLYGLTDSRVLRKSFLRVRGADLIHVQDVEVSQSLLGKIFGYGDVLVRTASTDGTLVLKRVANPHDWFREISDLRG